LKGDKILMLIGVLALQGAFREHQQTLAALGVSSRRVKKPEDLDGLDGLIIPGGESTTMSKLLGDYHLLTPLKDKTAAGLPVFGTCAGLIIMAKDIYGSNQTRLGLLDILVARNAFGRQVESFEDKLIIPAVGEKPFPAVFIRAPYVMEAKPEVKILATYKEKIVFVQQGKCLAAAFHPELTSDYRLHQYFINQL
jgi:5'-phosphate synthase pdxT subunit